MFSQSPRFKNLLTPVLLAVLTVTIGSAGTAFAVDQVTKRSDRVTFRGEITAMAPKSVPAVRRSGRQSAAMSSRCQRPKPKWSVR
jgi:hypothetical protein